MISLRERVRDGESLLERNKGTFRISAWNFGGISKSH